MKPSIFKVKKIATAIAITATVFSFSQNLNAHTNHDSQKSAINIPKSAIAQSESNSAKESKEGLFNFYVYISQVGANNFIEQLKSANKTNYDNLNNARTYMTANLDLPNYIDKNGQKKHILLAGFSNGMIAQIEFNTQDYDKGKTKVTGLELLQGDPSRYGWQGGIQSLAYDAKSHTIFAGLGDVAYEHESGAQWDPTALLAFTISIDWTARTDSDGGYIYAYNAYKGGHWQNVAGGSKSQGSVMTMRGMNYHDKTYLFSYANNSQPPQTLHSGFSLSYEGQAGPIPIIIPMPTGSGGDTKWLSMPTDGMQISTQQEDGTWYHRSVSPQDIATKWGDMPNQIAMGSNADMAMFAAFPKSSNNAIKVLDLNAMSNQSSGWNDIVVNKAWAPIQSFVYDPYKSDQNKSGWLIAGLQDGTVQGVNLQEWADGKDGYHVLKSEGWSSSIDFLRIVPPAQGQSTGRYIIAFLDDAAVEYYDMKTEKWTEIHPADTDGSLKPTAVSNVIRDGQNDIVYEGYNNGIIIKITINRTTGDHHFEDIKIQPAPMRGGFEWRVTNGTSAYKGEIYPYAVNLEADKNYLISHTANLSGSYASEGADILYSDGGMGIQVHQIGVKNDWNHISPESPGH